MLLARAHATSCGSSTHYTITGEEKRPQEDTAYLHNAPHLFALIGRAEAVPLRESPFSGIHHKRGVMGFTYKWRLEGKSLKAGLRFQVLGIHSYGKQEMGNAFISGECCSVSAY